MPFVFPLPASQEMARFFTIFTFLFDSSGLIEGNGWVTGKEKWNCKIDKKNKRLDGTVAAKLFARTTMRTIFFCFMKMRNLIRFHAIYSNGYMYAYLCLWSIYAFGCCCCYLNDCRCIVNASRKTSNAPLALDMFYVFAYTSPEV